MAATYERLWSTLTSELPGSIPASVRLALSNTINEFCRESRAWREQVEVTLEVDKTRYVVAAHDALIVEAYTISHPTLNFARAFYKEGAVTLFEFPTSRDIPYPLLVYCALAPLPPALDQTDISALLPVDIWNDHEATLYAGTMARMMMQPLKPYTNPQLAVAHRRDFFMKAAEARVRATKLDAEYGQTWHFPRFA